MDKKRVEQLDKIPYRDMLKWGMIARTIINNKQKLGLGVGSSCRSLVEGGSLRSSKNSEMDGLN